MQDNNLIPLTEAAGEASGSAGPIRAGRIACARTRRCAADTTSAP